MAQGYTPIWDDWLEVTRELNAQEKGRLIDAIVVYKLHGDWQEQIKGNERYVFPTYQVRIDRWNEVAEGRARAGYEGGKKSQANTSKTEQLEATESKVKQNEANVSKTPKVKVKEKDKDKVNNTPSGFDAFWEVYPKHQDKQGAIKAFSKINPDAELLEKMISSVKVWKASQQWTKDGGQYIPMPATWLNGHRWEDEAPKIVTIGKQVSAQNYTQRQYSEAELEARTDDL